MLISKQGFANHILAQCFFFLGGGVYLSPLMIALFCIYSFTTQFRLLMALKKKAFENIVGKGENADNQHFLLFPQCFLRYQTE